MKLTLGAWFFIGFMIISLVASCLAMYNLIFGWTDFPGETK